MWPPRYGTPLCPLRAPGIIGRGIHRSLEIHRVNTCHDRHGGRSDDPFAWLAQGGDPDVADFLAAGNDHTEAMTAHLRPLRESLFAELKARVVEADITVPARKGLWWYYGRSEAAQEHPLRCRRPAQDDSPPPSIS